VVVVEGVLVTIFVVEVVVEVVVVVLERYE